MHARSNCAGPMARTPTQLLWLTSFAFPAAHLPSQGPGRQRTAGGRSVLESPVLVTCPGHLSPQPDRAHSQPRAATALCPRQKAMESFTRAQGGRQTEFSAPQLMAEWGWGQGQGLLTHFTLCFPRASKWVHTWVCKMGWTPPDALNTPLGYHLCPLCHPLSCFREAGGHGEESSSHCVNKVGKLRHRVGSCCKVR